MRAHRATLTAVAIRLAVALALASGSAGSAQQPGRGTGAQGRGAAAPPAPIGIPRSQLGDGPWVLDTAEQHKIRVIVVTKGLANPWSLAFLPDGRCS